jgi:hypothetical protein
MISLLFSPAGKCAASGTSGRASGAHAAFSTRRAGGVAKFYSRLLIFAPDGAWQMLSAFVARITAGNAEVRLCKFYRMQ